MDNSKQIDNIIAVDKANIKKAVSTQETKIMQKAQYPKDEVKQETGYETPV